MDVDIAGTTIRLEQQQVVGLGGEGTVFLAQINGQPMAVKIYHDPTLQRQEKLTAFLAQRWKLPLHKIARPLQVVRDIQQGNVIGFTMSYLESGFEEIARLAHKKHRAASLVTNKQVTSVFLDSAEALASIHRNGLVVGDFNDQNSVYKQAMMLWIDVDAWQFAQYPCPVATEDFLVPELYGIDLSLRPAFKPEYDWYAFAIHLFRSLLLAHPYGGTHKAVQSLTKRAQERLFVFDSSVTYPKIAYPPDILSDELTEVFERIFAKGWRGTFPLAVLQHYHDSLVECRKCKMHYPQSRKRCPLCHVKTTTILTQPVVSHAGVSAIELVRTTGKIVFCKVQAQTIHVVAYESGQTVLYSKQPGLAPQRKVLQKEIPGTRYDLMGHILLLNAPGTTQLLCIDIAKEQPVTLCQAETALFAARREAMFQASQTHIFSLVNNALLCGTVEDGALCGRALRTIMEKQTWFTVAQQTEDGKPTVFGYFQVFRQQMYWLIRGRAVYDVALPELHPAETLLDLAVYFSAQSILIRRHTQEHGSDYLCTEMLDHRGRVIYTSARIKRTEHPYPDLHGLAYNTGMLLHPSDNGIVQEKVEQATFKTFSATRDYVQGGDALELYQAGLLVIGENQVTHLVI